MAPLRLTILDLDTATARTLSGLGTEHPGLAVATVRPDTRRPAWLARDLLASVGIRHSLSGKTRRDADDRQLTPMWLHAHGVTDVIVVGVEALPARLLPELIELCTLAGAALWLVADHILPDGLSDVLADWPVQPCPPADFRRRWLDDPPEHAPSTAGAAPRPADPLPPGVPHVDFPVFRAACRRQLDDGGFAAVDTRFREALDRSLDRIGGGADPLDVLRDGVATCQSATAVTVTTRAVQVAAFRHGRHLRVDLDALLAFDDHAPVASAADPATWTQLHAYRQPLRQTACALTLLGLAPATQMELCLGDVDLDRPAVRVDGQWRDLPDAARPTLVALRLSRLAAGAGPSDPLLARMDGRGASTRAVADAVNAVRRETGLRLTVGQVERKPVPTGRWARRRHLTVTDLEV